MPDPIVLESVISDYPSVLVGYSGGVDSTLVAIAAQDVLGSDRVVAAIGVSPSLSRAQHDQALRISGMFGIHLLEVKTDELDDPGYAANQPDRCYHCKRELWDKLSRLAGRIGMSVIADGTNADDLGDHRPGLVAASEFAVRSPLADAGYTKSDVRAEARARGIPIWDVPASPCLSSRVLYGLEVTPGRLAQVEAGETILRDLGVKGDLRVRHRGRDARIEAAQSQFPLIRECGDYVAEKFKELGFRRVELDLRGYRSGSLHTEDVASTEQLGIES
jgi:uncharacterized protein